MSPAGCIIKDAQTLLIWHLIVANIEITWIENGRVEVEDVYATICSLELSKMLLSKINQLLVLNGTSTDYHHVFAEVHPLVIFDNHLSIDPPDVFNLSENW